MGMTFSLAVSGVDQKGVKKQSWQTLSVNKGAIYLLFIII